MQISKDHDRRRLLTAFGAIAFGLNFLTHCLTYALYEGIQETPLLIAARGFTAPVHMTFLIGAVFGITQLLRRQADRLGLFAGTLTLVGWAAGIRIIALRQLEALFGSGVTGVDPQALATTLNAVPIIWGSIVPMGLLFPIGLVMLGATLAVVRVIPRPLGILLVIGGAIFPISRIGGMAWALVSCDLVLGATFALIGWQILRQKEAWQED